MSPITEDLELAQEYADRALGKFSQAAGRLYVGSLQDYRTLVALSLKLRHLSKQIERRTLAQAKRNVSDTRVAEPPGGPSVDGAT